MREGFWHSEREPDLPHPSRLADLKWTRRDAFVAVLHALENELVSQTDRISNPRVTHYLGFSSCRMCDLHTNGTMEFNYRGWCWPEGYLHYIEHHHVRPSLAFEEFVLGIAPVVPDHTMSKAVDAAVDSIAQHEDREYLRLLEELAQSSLAQS